MIHRRVFGLPPDATDDDIDTGLGAHIPFGTELHRVGDTLVVLAPEFSTSILSVDGANLTVSDASDFAASQAARLYDAGVLTEKVSILSVKDNVVTLRRVPVHTDLTSKMLELRREWVLYASWNQYGDDFINDDGTEIEAAPEPHPADVAKAAIAAGESELVVVGKASAERILTPPEAEPVVAVPKSQWDVIMASKDPDVLAAVSAVDSPLESSVVLDKVKSL